jgi:hypothetical protein
MRAIKEVGIEARREDVRDLARFLGDEVLPKVI